ncbi:MAG: LPXTG cell wall anchor domain-containing protein [Kineosporiaceae bacterium]|nr:LPXTG cell wall anchor domain-containing protein [Aeromicrobium sp.]
MKHYFAVLFAVLIAMFSTAAPAAAAGELGISSDSVTYAPTFHGPLFGTAIRWVPGDSRTATFYVRNQSPDLASLAITLLGNHIGDLLESGDVTVTATGGGGAVSPVSNGNEQLLLLASGITGGEVVPVHVTVDFNESSPNDTQMRSTDLNFRISLTQSSITPQGNGGGNGNNGSASPLPNTGAPNITWIVALGSILLGTGIAIVSRRRQTHQGESHV